MQHLPALKGEPIVDHQKAVSSARDTWWQPMMAVGLGIESIIDRMICQVEKGTE